MSNFNLGRVLGEYAGEMAKGFWSAFAEFTGATSPTQKAVDPLDTALENMTGAVLQTAGIVTAGVAFAALDGADMAVRYGATVGGQIKDAVLANAPKLPPLKNISLNPNDGPVAQYRQLQAAMPSVWRRSLDPAAVAHTQAILAERGRLAEIITKSPELMQEAQQENLQRQVQLSAGQAERAIQEQAISRRLHR